MATLADIAKKCKISTAAVSYVLSGQGDRRRISPQVQEQVRAAAESLGYVRHVSAPKSGSLRIGFFWPGKNLETTIANVVTGINSAVQFETSPVEISIFPFSSNNLSSQTALWSAKSFDAAVILSPNTADMQALAQHRTKTPTIVINRQLEGYSSVSTDYQEVGRLAAEQAIARGGSNIALVRNIIPHLGMNQRSRAIYNVCKSYGINLDEKIYFCANGIDEAYELGVRLIREKMLPKIIVCVYDTDAFGITRALNEAGIAVGRDVEILAASTSLPQFFARSTPSLTVVDLKMAEISQRAVRMAIDLATGRLTAPTSVVISPEIIYRESSPVPTRDQLARLKEYRRSFERD